MQQDGQELNRLGQQDPSTRVQEAMLRMARDMREQGHVHEALQMYTQLMEDYPGTQASTAAANAMVELAQYLEQNGQPHTALFIYRQLEELQ
jgi:TolA-binding protein